MLSFLDELPSHVGTPVTGSRGGPNNGHKPAHNLHRISAVKAVSVKQRQTIDNIVQHFTDNSGCLLKRASHSSSASLHLIYSKSFKVMLFSPALGNLWCPNCHELVAVPVPYEEPLSKCESFCKL